MAVETGSVTPQHLAAQVRAETRGVAAEQIEQGRRLDSIEATLAGHGGRLDSSDTSVTEMRNEVGKLDTKLDLLRSSLQRELRLVLAAVSFLVVVLTGVLGLLLAG